MNTHNTAILVSIIMLLSSMFLEGNVRLFLLIMSFLWIGVALISYFGESKLERLKFELEKLTHQSRHIYQAGSLEKLNKIIKLLEGRK